MQITTMVWIWPRTCFKFTGSALPKFVVRKQLRRSQVMAFFKALPPCLVGMEACATVYCERPLTGFMPQWPGRALPADIGRL
jgi:hypothetical protein